MALSINQILAATKINGLALSKVAHEGGNYFIAEYKGWTKTIYVHAIGHMDRRQWIETLLSFVTEVMQDAPGENTLRPEPVSAEEPSESKAYALKLVYNADGSISVYARRKLVERFESVSGLTAQDRVDAFVAGWFGNAQPHIRRKFRHAAKRQS